MLKEFLRLRFENVVLAVAVFPGLWQLTNLSCKTILILTSLSLILTVQFFCCSYTFRVFLQFTFKYFACPTTNQYGVPSCVNEKSAKNEKATKKFLRRRRNNNLVHPEAWLLHRAINTFVYPCPTNHLYFISELYFSKHYYLQLGVKFKAQSQLCDWMGLQEKFQILVSENKIFLAFRCFYSYT